MRRLRLDCRRSEDDCDDAGDHNLPVKKGGLESSKPPNKGMQPNAKSVAFMLETCRSSGCVRGAADAER